MHQPRLSLTDSILFVIFLQIEESDPVIMDSFPPAVGVRREHYRDFMNRKAQEQMLGRKINPAEFRANPDLLIPYVSRSKRLQASESCQEKILDLNLNIDIE
jgi:hypothetical protein